MKAVARENNYGTVGTQWIERNRAVAFTNAAWTDWQDASVCAPRELTDTISPGAQKTFTDTRRVSDMRTLSGGLLPAGRYYAWLVGDVEFPAQTFKGRLGWVTLAPASP